MAPATVERPGAWHRKAEPSDAGKSYAAALARRPHPHPAGRNGRQGSRWMH